MKPLPHQNLQFSLTPPVVNPDTGRYAESIGINALGFGSRNYILKSINRLGIFADKILISPEDICTALNEYGHLLRPRQAEALRVWCRRHI